MRFVYLWVFLALLVSPIALAHENQPFADWLVVSDMLRSKGIEPSHVDWATIDPMCSHLIKSGDASEYNKCLYERVTDKNQWVVDKQFCSKGARSQYPDSLLRQRNRIYQSYGVNGSTSVQSIESTYFSTRQELSDARDFAYEECMRVYGWNNPDDWVLGKSETKYVRQSQSQLQN